LAWPGQLPVIHNKLVILKQATLYELARPQVVVDNSYLHNRPAHGLGNSVDRQAAIDYVSALKPVGIPDKLVFRYASRARAEGTT